MALRILLPLFLLAGTLSAQITAVRNGASYGTELTAGAWAYVTGTFTGVATGVNPSSPISKSFNGVSIKVGGVDAPVWYTSNVQINFLIPQALTEGQHAIEVTTGGGTFSSTLRLLSTAPGLFQKDADTPPRGAVLDTSYVEITSTHVAKRGEFIQIFGSGAGAYQHAVVDGAPVAAANPSLSTPEVYIGGVRAEINYSGLAPSAAGLWQINAKVPSQAFITGRIAVDIFMDGVQANEVTIFVE